MVTGDGRLGAVDRGRLEAFSDGVLAVAITLLVLDLHVSADGPGSLAHQLAQRWPSFAAYVVSFSVIGVVWINHHTLLRLAAKVDRQLLFFNLMLLFFVTTIPFATSTLADYLHPAHGNSTRIAVLLYGATTEGMAISFSLILWHIIRAGLTHHPVPAEQRRDALRRFGLGTLLYPIATLVGLINAPVMLLLYAGLTLYYILDQTPLLPTEPKAHRSRVGGHHTAGSDVGGSTASPDGDGLRNGEADDSRHE
jgi:uncharacterized membrane protein